MGLNFKYWKRDLIWGISITLFLFLVAAPSLSTGAIWASAALYIAFLLKRKNSRNILGIARVLAFQSFLASLYGLSVLVYGFNFFTFVFLVLILTYISLFIVYKVSTTVCLEYDKEEKIDFKPFKNLIVINAFLFFFQFLVLFGLRF